MRIAESPMSLVTPRSIDWTLRVARAVGVAAIILHIGWIVVAFSDTAWLGADGTQIWAQAWRIKSGEQLYPPMPADYGPHVMTAEHDFPLLASPYLPPLAALVSLAPQTNALAFTQAHLLFVFGLSWLYAVILCRLAMNAVTIRGWLAALGLLMLVPGAFGLLAVNNTEPLLWCLFGAAFLFPRFRAAFLACMAGVKVHAAWPLMVLMVRRPREAVPSGGLAVLGLLIVAAMGMGTEGTIAAAMDWLRNIAPAMAQGTFKSSNVSVSFLALRAARWLGWEYTTGPLPAIARGWLLVASTTAPLVAAWLTRGHSAQAQIGTVMAAALLASPLCWNGYLAGLLAPVAWAIGRSRDHGGCIAGGGLSGAASATVEPRTSA